MCLCRTWFVRQMIWWHVGTCLFVSVLSEVWAAAGAVMSGALRGQNRNYWTEGGWQSELALGANRCCNHKEIHNLWIKYEERGVARIEHTSRLSVTCPIAATCCKFRNHRLVGGHHHEKQVNRLNYAGFKTSRTGCDQKTLEEKKHLARRQLFRTYCRFIIHKQRVSGHSMLCQSVLKHLRHSGSVMKSVKKRRIWQNVLRTLFYHKCFVSQPFYRVFHSQGITSVSEYLMAEAMETLLRLLIFVILQFASCAPWFFTRN